MRLYDLVYQLIESFAPMDERSRTEIKTDAIAWYNSRQKEADIAQANLAEGEKLAPKHKVMFVLEKWYTRTIFAVAFIWLKRKIQSWQEPVPLDDEPYDDEHEERR